MNDFNDKLTHFNFGHFKNDKPALIQQEHLSNSSSLLRQSAAQMITLAHTLPFLIRDWTISCENEDLDERLDLIILFPNLPFAERFHEFIPEENRLTCKFMQSPKIVVNGTEYNARSIILLDDDENTLPKFREVKDIWKKKRL